MEDKYAWKSYDEINEEDIWRIADSLDFYNLFYYVTSVDAEILNVPLEIANTPSLKLQFLVDDNPNHVISSTNLTARVYGLYYDVPPNKFEEILRTLNTLNCMPHYMSIQMDPDGEIYMKYDFPSSCSKNQVTGPMAFEVLVDTKQFLMENYCTLLNILKDDDDGEFVPKYKWERGNDYLKETCENTSPHKVYNRCDYLDEIYGSMEYQCWVPFDGDENE